MEINLIDSNVDIGKFWKDGWGHNLVLEVGVSGGDGAGGAGFSPPPPPVGRGSDTPLRPLLSTGLSRL